MYAIVTIGGKQWRAEPDAVLDVPLFAAEPGATVTFEQVNLVADSGKVTLGKPWIDKARVTVTVLEHGRGPKLVVGKFKRRKKYRVKKGHRQGFTRVQVSAIEV
jgi:large subunit ribosomal protein L21